MRGAWRLRAWLSDHPMVLVVFLILAAVWDQSYNGQVVLAQSQQVQCERTGARLVADANDLRGDIATLAAQVRADESIASSSAVPGSARAARALSAEAGREAIRRKWLDLRVVDGLTDSGLWRGLQDRWDRDAVRFGVPVGPGRRAETFACDRAYPPASPFRFAW